MRTPPRAGLLRRTALSLLCILGLGTWGSAIPPESWPAEALGDATNLTGIEGEGQNDFYADLSGVMWNSLTSTLWICRNGGGATPGKLWAAVGDGAGGFEIDVRSGQRGEWDLPGDVEGVTQADFAEDVVYVIVESEAVIREYDVSAYGQTILNNEWSVGSFIPRSGGLGPEGITFVPDSYLQTLGFVDQSGTPYSSTGGMGGLMFIGNQDGGRIYVFDLDRSTDSFVFVGEFATNYGEVAGLEFDRSTGQLYVWHDDDLDVLTVLTLRSRPVVDQSYRRFITRSIYLGPSHRNNEGIAVMPADECLGGRGFFMTTDGGGERSLILFREFQDGCPDTSCLPGSVNDTSEPVLFINGSAGDGNYQVVVQRETPMMVDLLASSAGSGQGRYILWAWRGASMNPTDLVLRGDLLGCMANPTPFHVGADPQPFQCLRGAGIPDFACGDAARINAGGLVVPWRITLAQGIDTSGVFTIQGLIEDEGAANTTGFSVTNGIVLRLD